MVEGVVYQALQGLVAGRCFPLHFPQEPDKPKWPAIRYTVVTEDAEEDLCGTTDVDEDDVRIQIDVVALTFGAMTSLRDQVITAMKNLDPPCVRQPGSFQTFDEETKTYRAVIDYLFQQSSA